LVNGCHHTYISTKTRLGPENFRWIPSECGKTTPPWKCEDKPTSEEAKDFNKKYGFWITESSYNLRPEVIESYYYAYRITKNEKYRDWAWDAWQGINTTTRLDHGFNYLRNVNAPDEGMGDNQESYFFSETLKYLFLIFSDDSEWHVNFHGQNSWVYSTEGHPFKVRQK
jgi:mannosyl-oligosaccharide alpha-1,2-mannosidase